MVTTKYELYVEFTLGKTGRRPGRQARVRTEKRVETRSLIGRRVLENRDPHDPRPAQE